MKKNNLKRFLASLLAVLMLSQVTGVAPSVFADVLGGDTQTEETQYEAPQLCSGTAVIPEGSDVATVNKLLAKALIANYDKCDPATRDSLEWEYECEGKYGLLTNTDWGSIAGFTSSKKVGFVTTKYTHPALAANEDGNYQVRIKGISGEVTLTKAAKLSSSISAQDVTLSMPYTEEGNIDFDQLRAEIFENAVVATDPKLSISDVSFVYYAKNKSNITIGGAGYDWVGFEGSTVYPEISVGAQKVKVSWAGNDSYYASSAEFTVTLVGREQAEIALRDNVEVALTYKADGSVDYANIETLVLAAAVESSTPTLTVNNTEITYYATGSAGSIGKAWVPLNGGSKGLLNYPGVSAGSYDVKLSFKGDDAYLPKTVELSISFVDARSQASINFNENPTVKIPYTEDIKIDFDALRTAIWNNIVSETTPASLTVNDVTIMYQVKTLTGHDWEKLEGSRIYSAISEGAQKLQITYAGNSEYKGFVKEIDVQFVGREEAPFKFNSEVTELGLVYNKDSSIDYEATAQRIREALVTATGDISIDGITVEYNNTFDDIPHFVPLDNKANKLNLFGLGQFTIRLSWDGNREYRAWEQTISINFTDNRIQSKVEIRADATITYNMDANIMLQAIFDNAIDWTSSTLPAKETLTIEDFVITYKASGQPVIGDDMSNEFLDYLTKNFQREDWVPVAGDHKTITILKTEIGVIYPQMGAGEQQISIQYVGNAEYKPSEAAEGTLTVNKASVKVKVKPIIRMYAGENDLPEGSITLNPNDTSIDIYTVYAGITSKIGGKVTTGVYVDLPDRYLSNSFVLKTINLFIEPIIGKTMQDIMQEGITVGELKKLAEKAGEAAGVLGKIGIDVESFQKLMEIIAGLPSIADDMVIAIGTPNHAGIYQAYVITNSPNYKVAFGIGTVHVRKNISGISIVKNESLNDGTLTVSEATKISSGEDRLCTLNNSDGPLANTAQGALHFRFTGLNNGKFYSSHDMPTDPGKYIVTVSVRGGDFYAFPKTFSFTIVPDPAPEVSPEA